MAASLIPQYDAILCRAREMGLPKHWATDLEIDRQVLAFEQPDRFVWVLYECGTRLYSLSTDAVSGPPGARRVTVWDSFPFCAYYLYQRDPRQYWFTFELHRATQLEEVTAHEWWAFYVWAVRGGRWGQTDIYMPHMPDRPLGGFPRERRDLALAEVMRYQEKYRLAAEARRAWLRGRTIPLCRIIAEGEKTNQASS